MFNISFSGLLHPNGTTIHTAMSIVPTKKNLSKLDSNKSMKLNRIQLLIIDEISMVSEQLLQQVHNRLTSIKNNNDPFGGVAGFI
jgi:hypothetical protein